MQKLTNQENWWLLAKTTNRKTCKWSLHPYVFARINIIKNIIYCGVILLRIDVQKSNIIKNSYALSKNGKHKIL